MKALALFLICFSCFADDKYVRTFCDGIEKIRWPETPGSFPSTKEWIKAESESAKMTSISNCPHGEASWYFNGKYHIQKISPIIKLTPNCFIAKSGKKYCEVQK